MCRGFVPDCLASRVCLRFACFWGFVDRFCAAWFDCNVGSDAKRLKKPFTGYPPMQNTCNNTPILATLTQSVTISRPLDISAVIWFLTDDTAPLCATYYPACDAYEAYTPGQTQSHANHTKTDYAAAYRRRLLVLCDELDIQYDYSTMLSEVADDYEITNAQIERYIRRNYQDIDIAAECA